ncbi:hypothetical protein ACWF9G_27255 [Nocardia sp. NPDC055029]
MHPDRGLHVGDVESRPDRLIRIRRVGNLLRRSWIRRATAGAVCIDSDALEDNRSNGEAAKLNYDAVEAVRIHGHGQDGTESGVVAEHQELPDDDWGR